MLSIFEALLSYCFYFLGHCFLSAFYFTVAATLLLSLLRNCSHYSFYFLICYRFAFIFRAVAFLLLSYFNVLLSYCFHPMLVWGIAFIPLLLWCFHAAFEELLSYCYQAFIVLIFYYVLISTLLHQLRNIQYKVNIFLHGT